MPNRFTRGKALVGALSVDADLTVLKNAQTTGTFAVTGAATFGGAVSVTGASTFLGAVTLPTVGSVPAPAGTAEDEDVEARAAIGSIIDILQAVGLSA